MHDIDFMKPFVQIQDKHGAVASIYYKDDQKHEVHYFDNHGVKFYTEEFSDFAIEHVEQSVVNWALGKRELI